MSATFVWEPAELRTDDDGMSYAICRYRWRREAAPEVLQNRIDEWELEADPAVGGYRLDADEVAENCVRDYKDKLEAQGRDLRDGVWPAVLEIHHPDTDTWLSYEVAAELEPRLFLVRKDNPC